MKTESDEDEEFLFKFQFAIPAEDGELTLSEFYRRSISDLLKVVRFFSHGKPVQVDSFAFLNEPTRQIKILQPRQLQQNLDDHIGHFPSSEKSGHRPS